jgi:hypothetical protein
MAHDVFISHSSNNRTIANAVCAALESAGIRCWLAPRDVLPGRSYSGEITRAIQQSRAFVLIFSEHSNNSEQVLREVQLAANSRLHIVQFRIDPISPSDDLEYYLSGPHWLDAVTPPLEDHLEQLKSSMKALLALPRTAGGDTPDPAASPQPSPPPPAPYVSPATTPPPPPMANASSSSAWKWMAIAIAAVLVLGCIAVVAVFLFFQRRTPAPPAPPITQVTPAPTIAPPPPSTRTERAAVPQLSVAPLSKSKLLTTEEAEVYIREFHRDMEHGDLKATVEYLDDVVEYYSFGPKDKAFVGELLRQYFAAVPVRAFDVDNVKVEEGPKPTVATLTFDTHYSVRDALGNPATGRTHTEWDVVRRAGGLKIIRTNWITYPDPSPAR